MFTGIVTDIGDVVAVRARGEGLHRIKIACSYERTSIVEGASIACSGACLTVVGIGEEDGRTWFAVDAAAETLRLTTVGGHVDGLATLVKREDLTEMSRMTLRAPKPLARFIAAKGSVTLDGVSLTV